MDNTRDTHNSPRYIFRSEGRYRYAFREGILPEFSPSMFCPEYWRDSKPSKCTHSGRGEVLCVRLGELNCVLRRYYRGGVMRRFSEDTYLRPFLGRSRAEREFSLLLQMQALGLPVPAPVGYRVVYEGFRCKMDLAMEKIPNAQNLVEILQENPLENSGFQEIGRTVRQFHENNFCHADLNAHNIMLDESGKVWLIDFDKAKKVKWRNGWKKRNLSRLKRSIEKEAGRQDRFYWKSEAWESLVKGYNG